MSFTQKTIANRHAVWAMALAAAIFGTMAYLGMPMQLFPDTAPPVVNVITVWPGASSEDVAEDLSKPLEEEFAALEGILEVESSSQDNLSVVSLEFQYSRKVEMAAIDVQNSIARIRSKLPDGILEPQVLQFSTSDRPVITVGVEAEDLARARTLAEEELAPRIQRVPGVAAVDVFGGAQEAILIDLDPRRMEAMHVPLKRVVAAIETNNLAMPAGRVRVERTSTSLRLMARAGSPEELAAIPIPIPKGGRVLVGDLGTVRRAPKEDDAVFGIDGRRMIGMQVFKTTDANTVDVVDRVMAEAEAIDHDYPELALTVGEESGTFAATSVSNLLDNVWQALFLASAIIFLFIGRAKASGVVILSMPLSYGLTFGFMKLLHMEFNMVTLSAVILAVGMVVDASVVVLENITRRFEQDGGTIEEAAVVGTDEVSLPVLAGVGTTLVVLIPLLFLEGFTGKTFGPLAMTLLLAFTSSAVVALVLLPTLTLFTGKTGWLDRVAERVTGPFRWLMDRLRGFYLKVLRAALSQRILTILVAIGTLVAGVRLMRHQGMETLPRMDTGGFFVSFETPPGTSLDETARVVAEIEKIIAKEPEVVKIQSQAGFEAGMRTMSQTGAQGPTQGFVSVTLTNRTDRDETIWDIEERVRSRIALVPNIKTFTVREVGNTAKATTTAPILVRLSGPDNMVLDRIGDEVLARMERVPDLAEPVRNWTIDLPRYMVRVDPYLAAQMGLNPAAVAAELQMGATGVSAGDLYVEDGATLPIVVRYERGAADSVSKLLRFPVTLQDGSVVPLGTVARVESKLGQALVTRQQNQPTLEISAFTRGDRALSFIVDDVQAMLDDLSLPAGYEVALTGEKKDMAEARGQLMGALAISILAVYLLLVGQLRSFLHPITIMMSIPLSVSGVGVALWLAGKPVSMPVMVGLILLVGTVVNNAIILIDFIRDRREGGMPRRDAVIGSVSTRFRPIMMTSMSTIVGMIPLAAEWALGAERFSPLAVAVIGGMTGATFLTMVVIPILYDLFDDIEGRLVSLVTRASNSAVMLSVVFLAALLVGRGARAEVVTVDLHAAVSKALERSPSLRGRRAMVRGAERRVRQAVGRMLPSLDVQARYSRLSYVEPGKIQFPADALPFPVDMPDMHLGEPIENVYNLRVTVQQPLFTGFSLLEGYRAASTGLELAETKATKAELDLRLEVEEAYWAVVRLTKKHEIAARALETVSERYEQLQELHREGRATALDLSRVGTKVEEARGNLVEVQGKLAAATRNLASLMGLSADAEVRVTEDLASEPPQAPSGSPKPVEVTIADKAAELREHMAKAERGRLWPKLMLQAGYTLASPNERYFPPKEEFNDSWDVSVVLQWKLWDWGVTWNGAGQAWDEVEQRRMEAEEVQRKVSVALDGAKLMLQSARARLESAEAYLDTTREALEVAKEELTHGRVTQSDLAEAELDLAAAESKVVDARVDIRVWTAKVRRLMGRE